MAIVQSFGAIENLVSPWYSGIRRESVLLYDRLNHDYASLYRVQPNVRVCVDFLARNIAQLGLHQFRRMSETDRVRLRDFGMTKLIKQPLPSRYKVTRYRFIEAMISDLGIYFNYYALKIRDQSGNVTGLLRIPPIYIYPRGSLVNSKYVVQIGSFKDEFEPEEIIHIRGYNPENPIFGLSPLETLRRILAEEDSAGEYRQEFWQQSARMGGVIERPMDAPDWSDTARTRFLADFADLYGGKGKGGKTAVLEDGMKWVAGSFSSRESEYLAGRKLSREECARSFHIPLTMVGILDNATFSNIEEQHKNLYQDALGPWLVMVEEDLDLQLLPEFSDEGVPVDEVYSEFNIAEKLKGSFEEQTKSLQSAIGRPFMTANEGRAMLNLPSLSGDADQLVTPLNVLVGGQASPTDSAPKAGHSNQKSFSKAFSSDHPELANAWQLKWVEVLSSHYRRQERAIVSRINPSLSDDGKGDLGNGVWFDLERWNSELQSDLLKLNLATALAWSEVMFGETGVILNRPDAFEERLIPYLSEHSRIQAEYINQSTEAKVSAGLNDPDPLETVKGIFKTALTVWVIQHAISAVTAASSFGSHEAAQASGLVSKTWHVNSSNPRDSHADLDGVTVGIREKFPNGLRWPGDPSGGADEVAGCQCTVEFKK